MDQTDEFAASLLIVRQTARDNNAYLIIDRADSSVFLHNGSNPGASFSS